MGFKNVYKCLLDIFPQVDSRILKAVAIENSKDVDAAAEIVLSEILPYMSKQTVAASSSSQNRSPQVQANEGIGVYSWIYNNEAANVETEELILLGNPEKSAENGKDKSSVGLINLRIENSLLNLENMDSGLSSKDGFVRTPHASPDTSADDSTSLLENTSSGGSSDYLNLDGPVDWNADLCRNSSLNGTLFGEENSVALLVPSSSQKQMPEDLRADLHSESDQSTGSEKQERSSVELKSQQDSISEMGNIEDDTFNPVVSRSSQTCRIDLLEEIIEDAKNNKKTMFQAMQSIMNLMREVELQEEAAERAKEEGARVGLDILVKVEELKQMLRHAKEANDMHAGEVYGEKAILATEVRELQSRLLSLSEERDKSLSILDEMRQTLKARIAAAEELMKTSKQEKLEKEESARNALTEQEAIMAKVVQESKILQQEAEENAKLRNFLMDRGQIVDLLQGEISVICEDVRLLKEKFDERIPLSKSISSSQTSCILASSSSALKSLASDRGPKQGETAKTPEKRSPTPSVDMQSPKSRTSEERYKADGKELSDDGWEFFEDAEL